MPAPAWLLEPGGPGPVRRSRTTRCTSSPSAACADEIPDTLILLEHPPVFTAGPPREGRRAARGTRSDRGAGGGLVRKIDRGGSFTFHGPGQLVGYPILDLGATPDAARYLRGLEEAVIRAVRRHRAWRCTAATTSRPASGRGDEKVCAIGVRLMRTRVTLHGFALNCDTDLSWFDGDRGVRAARHGVTSLHGCSAGTSRSTRCARPLAAHLARGCFDARTTSAAAGARVSGGRRPRPRAIGLRVGDDRVARRCSSQPSGQRSCSSIAHSTSRRRWMRTARQPASSTASRNGVGERQAVRAAAGQDSSGYGA